MLSYGLQTLKLVVVEDKLKRDQLVQHSYGQRQVIDSSHLLVICIQKEINDEDVDYHFNIIKEIRQTPDEILDPFKKGLKSTIQSMTKIKKNDWATRQAYIALGNLMTVCAMEHIDSCPMEGFVAEQVDEVLELYKYGLTSVLLFPVGFRAKDDMFASLKKVRKPLSETTIEI